MLRYSAWCGCLAPLVVYIYNFNSESATRLEKMTVKEIRSPQASPVDNSFCCRVVQHQLATVILIGIVAPWLFGFLELADEVMEGGSENFDREILLSMRTADDLSDPIGPGCAEAIARDVTALGSLVVLAGFTLFSVGYLLLTRKNWIAMSAMVFLTLGALTTRVQPLIRTKMYILSNVMFLTVIVGISRVYLGVHWPTEVLAGWVFGVT